MSFYGKINIWEDTVKRCNNFNFRPPQSSKYNYLDIIPKKKFTDTFVNVLNMDSIDCGYELLKLGYNPVILNMADDCFPGGEVKLGSGAQEESLFRRTNYFQTLNIETGFYPLREAQLVYSPKVTVIKDNMGVNLEMNKYYDLSFIACPAIRKPEIKGGKLNDEDRKIFIRKIRNILNVAYHNDHDSVVLSALGCGAWEGPQEDIARIFKKVIYDYMGVFRNINFAILEVSKSDYIVKNSNLDKSNFKIFHKIFYKEGSKEL